MKKLWIGKIACLAIAAVMVSLLKPMTARAIPYASVNAGDAAEVSALKAQEDAAAKAQDAASAAKAQDAATAAKAGDVSLAAANGETNPEQDAQELANEYADLAIATVDSYVNVRDLPSTDGKILGKIYNGAVAHVIETAGEENDWFHVTSGSVEGYIKAEYFIYGDDAAEVIESVVTRYAIVKVTRLNVRKETTTASKRIGYLDRGERAKVLDNLGDWLEVEYSEGAKGYVAAQYVDVTEEFTYAISIEEERAEIARKKALEERKKQEEAQAAEQLALEQAKAAQAAANGDGAQTNPDGTAVNPDGTQPATTTDATPTRSGPPKSDDEITPPASYTTNEELRNSLVEYALQFVGNSYVNGGNSLTNGTDCSGFTKLIYAQYGYSLGRTPASQLSSAGRSVDYSEIQKGDIICYSSNGGASCTHVAIYIGDGMVVHAANSKKGICTQKAIYSTIMGVKNIID
ncbi:MAG: SH3 domain-containing protein [Lachnospiraceae bacterium]|nr:SH3 domain-containing protein [Lachnospiraceae bacterium]